VKEYTHKTCFEQFHMKGPRANKLLKLQTFHSKCECELPSTRVHAKGFSSAKYAQIHYQDPKTGHHNFRRSSKQASLVGTDKISLLLSE
jgi:hypothetical protein